MSCSKVYQLPNSTTLEYVATYRRSSEEDQYLRQHILNLSCKFYTHWTQRDIQLSNWPIIQDNLALLEADGLVINSRQELTVTPKGRPFIRNICAALDGYLKRQMEERARFSQSI